MTQEELAERLGLTFQQVQKYETGANRVSASRLAAIAHILELPIGFFFHDVSPAIGGSDHQYRYRLLLPETINLVRNYAAIDEPAVQKAFLALVQAVAAVPAGAPDERASSGSKRVSTRPRNPKK